MSDLMLLGVLRAPTPEPNNVLGIAQLADRARQAADVLEAKDTLIAVLEAENARLRAVVDAAKEVINAPNRHDRRVELRWLDDALAEQDDGPD